MPRLRPQTEQKQQKKNHSKDFLKSVYGSGSGKGDNQSQIDIKDKEGKESQKDLEKENNMGDEEKKTNENKQPTPDADSTTSGGDDNSSTNENPQKAKTAPTEPTKTATTTKKTTFTSAEKVKLNKSPNTSIDSFIAEYNYIQCSNISTPMTKISCYFEHTITTHPAVLLTGVLTTLMCCYFFCRRTLQRNRRWNNKLRRGTRRRNGRRGSGLYTYDYEDDEMGEYAALAVYDELLDDFDKEDLSSAYTSGRDDDESDDDSIGTIISQWSGDFENGTGGPSFGIGAGIGKRRKGKSKGDGSGGVVRKIELTAFDDGNLSLSEVNG